MALETVVFQQDPYIDFKDHWPYSLLRQHIMTDAIDHRGPEYNCSCPSLGQDTSDSLKDNCGEIISPNSSTSSENNGIGTGGGFPYVASVTRRRKRRTKAAKNKEEVENQRMTHIAVERNRRRQMNDYLAILRTMMPPSYVQRGDQASIIGGAINFVKELEQLQQSLEAKERNRSSSTQHSLSMFSDFFTFPQYSTEANTQHRGSSPASGVVVADVEATVADGHATIKVRSRRQSAQLLKMVLGLHSLGLHVLHITLTASDLMVLFSFSVKVEESCELNSANEIATAVHELVATIQEEASCSL